MNFLDRAYKYLSGSQQEEAGRKHGRQNKMTDVQQHKLGSLMMSELQRTKEHINDESNCIKCRRTQRNRCKKHERMMLGLDALAGDIAQKYLDKEPAYLNNEDN